VDHDARFVDGVEFVDDVAVDEVALDEREVMDA
jgi:hypothetical protein